VASSGIPPLDPPELPPEEVEPEPELEPGYPKSVPESGVGELAVAQEIAVREPIAATRYVGMRNMLRTPAT
jgi:hypothetical protein